MIEVPITGIEVSEPDDVTFAPKVPVESGNWTNYWDLGTVAVTLGVSWDEAEDTWNYADLLLKLATANDNCGVLAMDPYSRYMAIASAHHYLQLITSG